MTRLTTLTFPIIKTLATEFRFHLGLYWRAIIDRNAIIIIRKAHEKSCAGVFMDKTLFDELVARALKIPYTPSNTIQADRIELVLKGPDEENATLDTITNQ